VYANIYGQAIATMNVCSEGGSCAARYLYHQQPITSNQRQNAFPFIVPTATTQPTNSKV